MPTPQLILPQLHQVKAELCKRSLYFFVKDFWDVIIKDPYEDNWHIEYLCDEVQLVLDKYVLERECHLKNSPDKWYKGITEDIKKNLIGNVPPGTSKSTILSRMAAAWVWCVDDSKTLIGNTISASNASGFAKDSLDIIRSDQYKLYFPHVKIRRDVSAKTYYESENGGVRYSYTTTAKSKTGKHAHALIDDDPMDYITAQSAAEAKECIEGYKALISRKKDKRKTPYILFMQRLSSKDTVAHTLKTLAGDVRHICLPAEDIHNNINPPELKQYYNDGLLDPKRLSREVLMAQRTGLADDSKPISDIAYNIQYNQVSQSIEGLLYPALNFVDSLPDNRNDIIRLSFTDVADTGSDYFSTWFAEVNQGKIYVFDAIYTQEPSAVTSERYKAKVEMHGSMINRMETNNQGSVYITLLHRLGVHVAGYTNTGNKDERITAYAQFMPFLYFVEPNENSSPEYKSAIKHLQAYPKQGKAEDGHDDAEDSLTELMRYIYTNMQHLFIKH